MKVALCIGETKEEYEAGLNEAVCGIQLVSGLADVTVEQMKNVVIAYEPVWAIGTGLVCSKEEAQNIHAYIRSRLAQQFNDDVARQTIIQYGGSVKPDNVKELMAMPDIDGCLVGGASLNAESFAKIVGYKHDGLTIDISSEPALADTVKEMSKRARVKRFLKRLLPGFMKRQ